MLEALSRPGVISIGSPTVHLSRRDELPVEGNSYIQLYFLKGKRIVNLYHGYHPVFRLTKSSLCLRVSFNPKAEKVDIGIFLRDKIEEEAMKLMAAANIRISRGSPAGNKAEFYHFKVEQDAPVAGFEFDQTAFAHQSYFEQNDMA